jgi:uncharacterized protein (DUF433 family)
VELEEYVEFLTPNDIRIKGTRIGIETVLYDFIYRSRSPETIVAAYPSLTLEQVYATITFCLHDKEKVTAYLSRWLETSKRRREEQNRHPSPAVRMLRALAAERHASESSKP